jgi:hypothetical protein
MTANLATEVRSKREGLFKLKMIIKIRTNQYFEKWSLRFSCDHNNTETLQNYMVASWTIIEIRRKQLKNISFASLITRQ